MEKFYESWSFLQVLRVDTVSIGQGQHFHAKYLIKVEKLTSAAPKIIIKNSILLFSNIKYFSKISNEWLLNTTESLIEACMST